MDTNSQYSESTIRRAQIRARRSVQAHWLWESNWAWKKRLDSLCPVRCGELFGAHEKVYDVLNSHLFSEEDLEEGLFLP